MRLLRCHIDNFGKLSDFTVDFTENPMVFHEPNGWGKSTLAAFIKVMFYGFANEKKRGDSLERERLRYRPWQGGVYGGELAFEAAGKSYLLNRTFGAKEAEDSFALYDGATNLKSDDFTENIGEELFQINQESFLRTVFIGQNDCVTAATDSINAKIGNLADNLDDMNNYEKVQQVLKDLRNSLTPTRKTGSLKRQKEEIAELKDELRRVTVVEGAVTELEKKLADSIEARDRLTAERKQVQAEWELVTRQKEVEAKKVHYESILRQCEEKQASAAGKLETMGGRAPEREKLQRMLEQRNQMRQQESEANANSLNAQEQRELQRLKLRFADGIPEEIDLKRGHILMSQMEQIRMEAAQTQLSREEQRELDSLKTRFDENPGDKIAEESIENRLEEGLRQCGTCIDKRNGLGTKKATLSSLQHLEQSAGKGAMPMTAAVVALVLGIVFIGAGIFVRQLETAGLWMAVLLFGAGILLICVSIGRCVLGKLCTGRGQKKTAQDSGAALLEQEIARDEQEIEQAEGYLAELLGLFGEDLNGHTGDLQQLRDTLYGIRNDWRYYGRLQAREQDYQDRGYETQIQSKMSQLREILSPYCGEEDFGQENPYGEFLAALEQDRTAYLLLNSREQKYLQAEAAEQKNGTEILEFLAEYGQRETKNLDAALQCLVEQLKDYENDLHNLTGLQKEREDFEREYDIRKFEEISAAGEDTEDVLKKRLEELDDQIAETGEHIHAYRGQLDDRQQELEELQVQKERLVELEEAYDRDYAYFRNLGLTGEYLEKAKESLAAKYIGPVMESFRRNYALLAGEPGEEFRMDANIHLTRREQGEQREAKALSAGNQDLIYIVLRMALADAMYQKEKPFLIFDDSFVNLDGERLKKAGAFLRNIAEQYQVIYFTCHESRAL
jgi:DNA repair exonuclease SbcCD ATPase subunit